MAHVPSDHVAAGGPSIAIAGYVTVYLNAVVGGGEIAVEVCSCNFDDFVVLETASSLLHHGKSFWQNLVQHILGGVIDLVFQFFHLFVEILLLLNGHIIVVVQIVADFSQTSLFYLCSLTDFLSELHRFVTQIVCGKVFNGFVSFKSLVQFGLELFHIAIGLSAEKFGQKICHKFYVLKAAKVQKLCQHFMF